MWMHKPFLLSSSYYLSNIAAVTFSSCFCFARETLNKFLVQYPVSGQAALCCVNWKPTVHGRHTSRSSSSSRTRKPPRSPASTRPIEPYEISILANCQGGRKRVDHSHPFAPPSRSRPGGAPRPRRGYRICGAVEPPGHHGRCDQHSTAARIADESADAVN